MAAVFGRRMRRTAVTTAVAAAAVAALAASQAPGATSDDARDDRAGAAGSSPAPDGDSATGNSPYYTDLPPLKSPAPPTGKPGEGGVGTGEREAGLPATVLDAYKKAETAVRTDKPGCNLPWQLLAAIGKVESGQARGGRVDADGTTITPILGPVLDGNGFAMIKDSDNGAYDGDTTHDRAVGPMQFIPSTWAFAGKDGNADGKKDPNNIYDAALAAAHYLCANDRDLAVDDDLHAAILSYNRSTEYLNTVLSWLEYYRKGTHEVPDGTGVLPDDRSDTTRPVQPTRPAPRPSSPPTTPAPGPKPLPSPSPHKPSKQPGEKPGGKPDQAHRPGTPEPSTGTHKPPKPGDGSTGNPKPPRPSKPSEQVARLQNAGADELTATAGDAFDERVAVKAETGSGLGVAKVKVRFTVSGDTDTRFEGGARSVTVTTTATGTATAPELRAGERTGEFTVRARVVERSLSAVEVPATVTARTADTLKRLDDKPLICAPGQEFAEPLGFKATYKGERAAGVAATATLIKSAGNGTANDKGPYFKDADGKPVRALKGLTTDAEGKLLLPKLYADDTAGTYLLRVVTNGGATLTVELKVAAPAA
ncbi:lytic transglycosylase [Streptomyces sp. p1417]|uniref:Lytic transglycosylase n=1 Tax=Streptomyces typhae TaxID=2681492 RepID=A0A6L6WZR5_9ACTN|nr:lytic murein transglycosylase [Streptomyces typhae]MVO87002.1 lytic transglycosylase [Streptomyces typhae]